MGRTFAIFSRRLDWARVKLAPVIPVSTPLRTLRLVAKHSEMSTGPSFRYQHDGDPNDDFGWLAVEVKGEQFSGKGGFWVQWQDVREFGEKLASYPILQDAPVETSCAASGRAQVATLI